MSLLSPETRLSISTSETAPAKSPEQVQEPPPWYAKFPKATLPTNWISRIEVKSMLDNASGEGPQPGKDFLLVDLRRVDHQGGTVKSSLNLPAQSFYYTMPTLYNICTAAGIKSVIFYCGSSTGRGSRAASWFQEYINNNLPMSGPVPISYALEGGIRGWVGAGEEYAALMDGYEREYWEQQGGGKNCQK